MCHKGESNNIVIKILLSQTFGLNEEIEVGCTVYICEGDKIVEKNKTDNCAPCPLYYHRAPTHTDCCNCEPDEGIGQSEKKVKFAKQSLF